MKCICDIFFSLIMIVDNIFEYWSISDVNVIWNGNNYMMKLSKVLASWGFFYYCFFLEKLVVKYSISNFIMFFEGF